MTLWNLNTREVSPDMQPFLEHLPALFGSEKYSTEAAELVLQHHPQGRDLVERHFPVMEAHDVKYLQGIIAELEASER